MSATLSGKVSSDLRQSHPRLCTAAREKDPAYLAMKQAAKEQRREAYRVAKERHKATRAEEKTRAEAERNELQAEKRAAFDRALMALVHRGAKAG